MMRASLVRIAVICILLTHFGVHSKINGKIYAKTNQKYYVN